MRLTRALLIYFIVVFVGGALLGPVLYEIGHGVAALQKVPFHRFVDRAVLGLALICLWPLLRVMGITSWAAVGFANAAEKWRDIVPGFLIGFGSLAIIAIAAILSGARKSHFPTSGHEIATHILSAGLTAVVVAFLEEMLFRGALFGAMRKHWPLGTALVVSSMTYALAHFVQKAPEPTVVTWSSGLAMLPQMFGRLGELNALLPKVLVLFVAGLILAMAYQRTGSLFLSIGLHAGWIFWLKSYRFISTPVLSNVFWGGDELINGWLALFILLGVLFAVDWMFPKRAAQSVAAIA
jgi:membrane protease YdiL (CAAX protease family)